MQLHTKLFGKKKRNLTTVPSTGRSLFYLVKLSWWSSSTKETFFALFCFSHIAHTLHFSSWQRMISDKRNLYSVFISCFSFCFPKYCFVSYEWYFSEKKKRLIISRFGCCFFFLPFLQSSPEKNWQWKWKKNCWSLLLCLYTKNCFAQTNFCSSVYHYVNVGKKWETKSCHCVKATFDISFQRSAKKETSALSHKHKSRNQ